MNALPHATQLHDYPLPFPPKEAEMSAADFKKIDHFFEVEGLTVYASNPDSWRWMAASGKAGIAARVIDPFSQITGERKAATPDAELHKPKKFEDSRLIKWLTRAAHKKAYAPESFSAAADKDALAFAGFIGMSAEDWESFGTAPVLTASEINHFLSAHNAALSDIESAFFASEKFDLPPALANFYLKYLTQARRDIEAALTIAQSSGSVRLPRRCADARALSAFEGAGENPVRNEGGEYALSAAQDTALLMDEACDLAQMLLMMPIDPPDHLLRLNPQDIGRMASELVEAMALEPLPFFLKAKQLYLARADVCRFPPIERFAIALGENDLNSEEEWVVRIAKAYERLLGSLTPRTAQITNLKVARVRLTS